MRIGLRRFSSETVDRIEANSLEGAESSDLAASWPGTVAAGFVKPPSGEAAIAISMYAQWARSHARAGSNFLYSDGSATKSFPACPHLSRRRKGAGFWRPATAQFFAAAANTVTKTGPPGKRPCSIGWRSKGCPMLGRNMRRADWPNPSRTNRRGQQECPNLESQPVIAGDGNTSTGLRFRIGEARRLVVGACAQHSGRMGPSGYCRIVIDLSAGA